VSRSRDDWIDAAWAALGETGIEGVRVERLARRMGVTKGSFYWHFKDREALIGALLDRWFGLREESRPDFPHREPDPAERLWRVIERGITRGTQGQAAALRLWAQRHPAVARRIAEEDAQRRHFFTEQFRALGFMDGEAEVRADVYMAVISAEFLHSGGAKAADRLELARRKHEALVSPYGSAVPKRSAATSG